MQGIWNVLEGLSSASWAGNLGAWLEIINAIVGFVVIVWRVIHGLARERPSGSETRIDLVI